MRLPCEGGARPLQHLAGLGRSVGAQGVTANLIVESEEDGVVGAGGLRHLDPEQRTDDGDT